MEVFPAAGAGPSCGGGGEQRQLLEFLLCSLSLCETRGYIKLNMSLPQLKEKLEESWCELSPAVECGSVDAVSDGDQSAVQDVGDSGEMSVTGGEGGGDASHCEIGDGGEISVTESDCESDGGEISVTESHCEIGDSGDNGAAETAEIQEEDGRERVELNLQLSEGDEKFDGDLTHSVEEGDEGGCDMVESEVGSVIEEGVLGADEFNWTVSTPDINWTVSTPDISSVSGQMNTPQDPPHSTEEEAEREDTEDRETVGSTDSRSTQSNSADRATYTSSSSYHESYSTTSRHTQSSTATYTSSSSYHESYSTTSQHTQSSLSSRMSASTDRLTGTPYSASYSAGMGPTGIISPGVVPQPNFDDLSSSGASGEGACPSPHSLTNTHSTHSLLYYTPFSSSPPRSSLSTYHTAALSPSHPHPSHHTPYSQPSHSPSSQGTPSSPTDSQRHSLTPSHISLSSCSPPHPLTPSHISLSSCSPPHPLTPSHISLSSCSPPHTHTLSTDKGESSVIVLDSSDDEEADNKLDNLFSAMKLQSEKKKMASAKVRSRKSLSTFIVSDSQEEGVKEEDEDGEEDGDYQTHRDTEPTFFSRTPTASLTPYTPHTSHSPHTCCGSPVEEGISPRPPSTPDHCMTAPGGIHRRPLTEINHPTLRPVCGTEAKAKAPVMTPSAQKMFSRNKKTMARELYSLFNHSVFDNQLPQDLELVWNRKLRTTAGFCRNSGLLNNRRSQIELSSKVIDSYERLKNTLIHEMCHAAVWLINGIKDGGHRGHWRAWAAKANAVHPDLEPISRCHSYDISYKFHYKCTRCDFKIGRHSKSVNLKEARCPYCLSTLELEGTGSTRKLNRFAQFVQDNYADVKLLTPAGGHKVVMEKLKEQYYNSKAPALNLDDD